MKFSIAAICVLGLVSAETRTGPVDENHPYNEQEYFKDIPAFIDFNETTKNGILAHNFIKGLHRGLYSDPNFELNDECFGSRYPQLLNEANYLFTQNPFGAFIDNIWPQASMMYQIFYMIFTTCGFDEALH